MIRGHTPANGSGDFRSSHMPNPWYDGTSFRGRAAHSAARLLFPLAEARQANVVAALSMGGYGA